MLDQLGAREELLVAMRPAEACQIVDHGVGQVAEIAIGKDRGGAVTLGEPGPVEPEDQGNVGEAGRTRAERTIEEDLARGVRQMVVAADDVRDRHLGVVHDAAEDEEGRAVGADDDEIVQVDVLEDDAALHLVVDHGFALEGRAEAQHRSGPARRWRGEIPAGAVVGRPAAGGEGRPPARVELLGRAPAAVRPTGGEQCFGARAVEVQPGALVDGSLVPVEMEPGEGVEDRLDRFGGRALRIGVLDAKDEASAVVSREEVVEERRAGAADVEVAAGTRREARPHGHEIRTYSEGRRQVNGLTRQVFFSREFETPEVRLHTGSGAER